MIAEDSGIDVVEGDLTLLAADAIVNAANHSLLGGGGVDGAIHRRAGPRLLEACRALNGCATGEAKITPGFDLPARYVIHTVGPVWQGGACREDDLLASCYRSSLALANAKGLQSLAFPCISTGVYGFPKARAAAIAVANVRRCLERRSGSLRHVVFCCFSDDDADHYRGLLF